MFNNLVVRQGCLPLLLLRTTVLAAHAVALAVALTMSLAVALAVALAATTGHGGRLRARKYLNRVHWFYSGLLFSTDDAG